MKTTLKQLKNWNGKIYNNCVYIKGNKIENTEIVNELKLFNRVNNDYYAEWEVLAREERNEKNTKLISLLFNSKDELIHDAINNDLINPENEKVGKSFIITLFEDNKYNPERWTVDELIKDYKLRMLV